MTLHSISEMQAKLVDLGYLAPTNGSGGPSNIDGKFGERTLDAYNHYRATLGKGPVVQAQTLEVEVDLWPDEKPSPSVQTTPNPFDNPLVKIGLELILPSILKGIPALKVITFLAGYKTYLVGVIMILIGGADAAGWVIPGTTGWPALGWVFAGLIAVAGRSALAQSVLAVLEKLEGIDTSKLPPAP